jgi:mRNA-degrading endonuclease toxin of MazEF toxin-antitoxin module
LSAFKLFEDTFGQVLYVLENHVHLTVMVEHKGRTKAAVLSDPSFFDHVDVTTAFAPVEEERRKLQWAVVVPAELLAAGASH